MTKIPETLELLKAGVHFGHQTSRWYPKMAPFIFTTRNNIHIIDLEKTREYLEKADKAIKEIIGKGGKILFIGTKKQAQGFIEAEAKRCGMPFISEKWIGGLFTNYGNVNKLIKRYKDLVSKKEKGDLSKYTKKEQLDFDKEINKLHKLIKGLLDMEKIPEAVFIVDLKKEKTAFLEAKKRKVDVFALCDTNINPEGVKYVIPGNDDAIKSLELLIKFMADSVIEAKEEAKKVPVEEKPSPKKVIKK